MSPLWSTDFLAKKQGSESIPVIGVGQRASRQAGEGLVHQGQEGGASVFGLAVRNKA